MSGEITVLNLLGHFQISAKILRTPTAYSQEVIEDACTEENVAWLKETVSRPE